MHHGEIIYCADAIARFADSEKIVIVERLGSMPGLALPGGKKDAGEYLSTTICREFWEETGLQFILREVLGTYADSDRDPRGHYVSTVFIGVARGVRKDEPGKTRVIFFDLADLDAYRNRFVFDHADILEAYRSLF